jgi:hypothetical protein
VGTVADIYARFGDQLMPGAKRAMAAYVAENGQGKHGRHAYRLGELGVDRDALELRFAPYRERHHVARDPVT